MLTIQVCHIVGQRKKVSNFEHRLPSPQSELAEQALLFWVTSVQARICRAVEFLSVGRGWYFEENTG